MTISFSPNVLALREDRGEANLLHQPDGRLRRSSDAASTLSQVWAAGRARTMSVSNQIAGQLGTPDNTPLLVANDVLGGVALGAASSPSAALMAGLAGPGLAAALMEYLLQMHAAIQESLNGRLADARQRQATTDAIRSAQNDLRAIKDQIPANDLEQTQSMPDELRQRLESLGIDVNDVGEDGQYTRGELDNLLAATDNVLATATSDDQRFMLAVGRLFDRMDEIVTAVSKRASSLHESAVTILQNW